MKTKTKIKTKPTPRARKMWANYYPEATICWPTKRKALMRSGPSRRHRAIPVAVIPLHNPYALGDAMVSALTAIGVLPKQRKGGAK